MPGSQLSQNFDRRESLFIPESILSSIRNANLERKNKSDSLISDSKSGLSETLSVGKNKENL